MELQRAICKAGTEAVLQGKEVWGIENVNELREEFLSALMAIHLHSALSLPARTEQLYTGLCDKFGIDVTVDVKKKIGGLRADIVIYESSKENSKPITLVEIKKFAEAGKSLSISDDLRKDVAVLLKSRMKIYAGVLVCETTTEQIEKRQATLKNALLDGKIVFSAPVTTSQNWQWCFACAELN